MGMLLEIFCEDHIKDLHAGTHKMYHRLSILKVIIDLDGTTCNKMNLQFSRA